MLLYASFALTMISAAIGGQLDRSRRADLPMNPSALRTVTGISGIVALALFVSGFWVAWYVPLLLLAAGIGAYFIWMLTVGRWVAPVAGALLTGVLGMALAVPALFW